MEKTVFITGATAGFGKSCAEIFAKCGWKLILAARRTGRLEEMRRKLGEKTPVHIITLDVCDRAAVQKAVNTLPGDFARVDVLVNNAGLALGMEPAHTADLDDWDKMVDTNCKGLMYCTRFLLPGMVERNRGHIINLGSIAGDYPYPGGNTYGATKAFVKQFSLNLRADLIGTMVRVTNIEPGMAESEFSVVRFKGDEEKAKAVYKGTQSLKPEDIADMVYWVAGLPPHVNVNRLEVMPVCQASGFFAVNRESDDK